MRLDIIQAAFEQIMNTHRRACEGFEPIERAMVSKRVVAALGGYVADVTDDKQLTSIEAARQAALGVDVDPHVVGTAVRAAIVLSGAGQNVRDARNLVDEAIELSLKPGGLMDVVCNEGGTSKTADQVFDEIEKEELPEDDK